MPWYFALSVSILVILIAIYKKLNIGLAMLSGSIVLGLLSRLSVSDLLEVAVTGFRNNVTIMLVLSVLLLGILGYILKNTGALGETIANLNSIVSDVRVVTAALPALVGMLTVPGGAILSAPLCAEAGARLHLPPERQAVINIWFRHVLYFMLPLFPSLILASQLSGVSIGRFVIHNLPLTIIGILTGFYFLFRGYKNDNNGFNFSWHKALLLSKSLIPLFLILILILLFDIYFPLALLAGIALALLNYLPSENKPAEIVDRFRRLIIPGIKLPVALVIAGIMIYKEMLNRTEVIADLTNFVLGMGIPVIFLLATIPFLVGMLTGDNSASVAILFPVFIPLLPADNYIYSAYLAFLYASSTAGHIISPAHPCFSLTKEYFAAELKNIILPILPLLAIIMAAGLLITILFGYY